jgi:hypothetical protein
MPHFDWRSPETYDGAAEFERRPSLGNAFGEIRTIIAIVMS